MTQKSMERPADVEQAFRLHWKWAVRNDYTDLGFEDWCEQTEIMMKSEPMQHIVRKITQAEIAGWLGRNAPGPNPPRTWRLDEDGTPRPD